MQARTGIIAAVLVALAVALAWLAPIRQPAGFHDYADQRTLLGLPHFWNLVSNLPFVVFGIMGIALKPSSTAWKTVFWGSLLAGLGSTWYHLAPSDETLVWDRIPIGIAFAAFLAALVEEHTKIRGDVLLAPLVVLSVAAIAYWRTSGDLSAWVFVQLAPMLAAALVVGLLPGRYPHRRYIVYALVWYGLAKLFEFADHQAMQWTGGLMSGHALKHLAAGVGVWCFYRMLRLR
jgi:hypothetical protein